MVRKRIENVSEIRGYIKARCKLGLTVKEIHSEIGSIYGDNKMSFATVYRWFKKFSSGQESVKDAPYSGRPKSAVTQCNVNKIKSIIAKDARFTVRQLARMTNLGLASVHFILKKILKVSKISARWIPHLLTDEQKRTRVQMAKQLLKKYPKYDKKLFDNIITGDETWVHFYEPKRKVDNRIWALKGAKRPRIAKRTVTAKKVLYAIFFRNTGPIVQIAVPRGRGVSGAFYKNVVLKTLRKKMRKLRPQTGLAYVNLLHDNAPAHKSSIVTDFLKSEKVNVLPHPPYSPDLAPCDFFLFPKLKKHLSGRRYRSRSALGSAIHQFLLSVPKQSYENCFKNWIKRLKQCVQAGGDYFEGN